MIRPFPKPPGPQPCPKPTPKRLPTEKRMTFIMGLKCSDGFVVGSDTEITYGSINFQKKKLYDYHGEGNDGYDVIIGSAGDGSYIAMTAEKIRDAVKALASPTIENIKKIIGEVVLEVQEKHLKYWDIESRDRPAVSLIAGISDQKEFEVLEIDRTAISEIEISRCIGSGSELAEHLAEKVGAQGLSVSVAVHLVQQMFREVKSKGIYVGGNTQIIALRVPTMYRPSNGFFDLSSKDQRFLWGLDDIMLSAVRVALDNQKSEQALNTRMRALTKRLRGLRSDSIKARTPSGTMLQLTEFGTEYGNAFKDT
jgi:20S proteasome alpha/beta subunit